MTRLRRPRLVSGFALIAGAAIIGAFGVGRVATDSSNRASASALEQFRLADPNPAPLDGVYTYETNGSETLSGPTGGSHPYPATTTIAVIHTGCGVQLRWDALPGRSTTWLLCNSDGDVVPRGVDETHTFGKSDRTTYSCTQSTLAFTCTSAQGRESGHIVSLGETIITVAGTKFAAQVVQIVATVSGTTHGTETTDLRFEPRSLLPLAITIVNETSRNAGSVHYSEHAALQLLSTAPQR